MNFSSSLAQNITEELKEVVNQDINYFNSSGYIIASTNKDRIGDFHQGAKRVLETKKELIVEYDGEFLGSKKGINLPVYFNDDVVGVIGITGDKTEVEQYGKIIQRITQILIKDAYLKEKKLREEETKKQFIEELLFKDMDNPEYFTNWAEILGIELNSYNSVAIINFFNKESKNIVSSDLYDKFYKIIGDNILINPNNMILQSGKNIIIIYNSKIEFKEDILNSINRNIISSINSKYKDIVIKIGLGNPINSLLEIRASYLQARRALSIVSRSKSESIKAYSDLDLEIIIDSIPEAVKHFYLEKVFRDFSSKDFLKYSNNFLEYVNSNGSIKKASDNLFIHKNTLQYRLNSLHKETGYNPRDLKDMIILYLGFMMYKYK